MITIVNMMPRSMSGETTQDSEPNLAVNPANPKQIVATAFTPAPLGGADAPVYVSADSGNNWVLNAIVPGNGPFGTYDITTAFPTSGGVLYAGTINGATTELNILRTADVTANTPMTLLEHRGDHEDQPWIVALTSGGTDHVFVGNNNLGASSGATATIDLSADAATAPPPAGFAPQGIEHRSTAGQDGPPIRLAAAADGTVYAAFETWTKQDGSDLTLDVVVTRDDNLGTASAPFTALTDSDDSKTGQRVTTDRTVVWNDTMGQERLGGDLAIAVDPGNSSKVWIAWCDRVGGFSGTDWTVHVRVSSDRGQSWSDDVRTITNVKNPSLAVNSAGKLAMLYQQFTGGKWVTQLELTTDSWATPAVTLVLHTAPAGTPLRTFFPYLGDYVRLLAIGSDFYGVFCGNNTPDRANFPNGVRYQRNANWNTRVLLDTDNLTQVQASIDPFFFHYSEFPLPAIVTLVLSRTS
jgi:hypothetical protein